MRSSQPATGKLRMLILKTPCIRIPGGFTEKLLASCAFYNLGILTYFKIIVIKNMKRIWIPTVRNR